MLHSVQNEPDDHSFSEVDAGGDLGFLKGGGTRYLDGTRSGGMPPRKFLNFRCSEGLW